MFGKRARLDTAASAFDSLVHGVQATPGHCASASFLGSLAAEEEERARRVVKSKDITLVCIVPSLVDCRACCLLRVLAQHISLSLHLFRTISNTLPLSLVCHFEFESGRRV
jgi:hypothetical protein